jgi:hypothetical protein
MNGWVQLNRDTTQPEDENPIVRNHRTRKSHKPLRFNSTFFPGSQGRKKVAVVPLVMKPLSKTLKLPLGIVLPKRHLLVMWTDWLKRLLLRSEQCAEFTKQLRCL